MLPFCGCVLVALVVVSAVWIGLRIGFTGFLLVSSRVVHLEGSVSEIRLWPPFNLGALDLLLLTLCPALLSGCRLLILEDLSASLVTNLLSVASK